MSLKLRMAMLEAEYTQVQLAREMGVCESRLSRLVCGWAMPTGEERKKLARLLKKREVALFGEVLGEDEGVDEISAE